MIDTPASKPVNTTVMFADIAHSTLLFDHLGDEGAARLVGEILGIATDIVTTNSGNVLRTKGDEVLCIFAEAADAATAAMAIHSAVRARSTPETGELAMRIGINTGPAILAQGDILGDAVNIAAKLAAFAKQGQTIITRDTLNALSASAPDVVRPVREISLRGKAGPVTLFELHDSCELDEITALGAAMPDRSASSRLQLSFQSRNLHLDYLLVRFLLGRAQECDLVLDHSLVSRHHAEICYQNGVFILRDFSTNGTVVISRGRSRTLHHGQASLRGRGSILLGRTGFDRRLEINFSADGG